PASGASDAFAEPWLWEVVCRASISTATAIIHSFSQRCHPRYMQVTVASGRRRTISIYELLLRGLRDFTVLDRLFTEYQQLWFQTRASIPAFSHKNPSTGGRSCEIAPGCVSPWPWCWPE